VITEHQLAQVNNLPIASDKARGLRGQVVVAVQDWGQASHRIPSAKVPPLLACVRQGAKPLTAREPSRAHSSRKWPVECQLTTST
jgi:hypothetical protein